MYIKITMAITVDGKTADKKGKWMPLCPYERERFYKNLEWADAIIVGAETVRHSNISFLPPKSRKTPLRVVLDYSLKLNPDYKIFNTEKAPTMLFTSCVSQRVQARIASIMRERKVEIKCIDSNGNDYIPPAEIVRELQKKNVDKILVVGGGRTNWLFIQHDLVDEYQLTVTPYLIGGSPYTPVGGAGYLFPGKKLFLYKIETCPCGQEVVLYYKLK